MQRQSLGSPGRERPLFISKDDAVLSTDDKKRRDSLPSSFSVANICVADKDDDEIKPEKPQRFNNSNYSQPEKFIHLIPILILFCFLVLYLSSHDPSPQDLAKFHGVNYKLPEDILEMNEIVENKKNKVLKRSDAFVIRSQRNLQEEIIIQPKSQSHRKLGDF